MAKGPFVLGAKQSFHRGIYRDGPRSAIPPDAVYDSIDYLLDQPLLARKRGGGSYAGPAMTGATYSAAVAVAEFSSGAQLLSVGQNGHLYKVTSGTTTDVGTLGFVPKDKPKFYVGNDKQFLVFCTDGGTDITLWNGTTLSTPDDGPAARYGALYKSRLAVGGRPNNPNRLYFSPAGPGLDVSGNWAMDDSDLGSWIDCSYEISGLAAVTNSLIVFSQGHMERIIGAVPPPDTDMERQPVSDIGCTDARSITMYKGNVIFANPTGVWMSAGLMPCCSLTKDGNIDRYWRELLSSYVASTWTISTGLMGQYLFVTILDSSGTLVDSLICDLPRRAWGRHTQPKTTMHASGIGTDELYVSVRDTNRVVKLSGFFTPSSSNKYEADGSTAVAPVLEFPIGEGLSLKHYDHGHLTCDLRDAASDNPTLAVAVAEGLGAATYSAVSESPFSETTAVGRPKITLAHKTQSLSVKLTQSGPSSKTEILGLEYAIHPFPESHGGVGA